MMILKTAQLEKAIMIAILLLFCIPVHGQGKKPDNPGLVAHYYKDTLYWGGHWTSVFPPNVTPEKWVFTKYLFTRVEPVVNHRFSMRSWFSVRWKGYIKIAGNADAPPEKITFGLKSRHGCRVKINGKTIVSDWDKNGNDEKTAWGETALSPGEHPIVIEAYFGKNTEIKKGLPLKLLWKSDAMGIKEEVIPKEALFHGLNDLVPPGPEKSVKPDND